MNSDEKALAISRLESEGSHGHDESLTCKSCSCLQYTHWGQESGVDEHTPSSKLECERIIADVSNHVGVQAKDTLTDWRLYAHYAVSLHAFWYEDVHC